MEVSDFVSTTVQNYTKKWKSIKNEDTKFV